MLVLLALLPLLLMVGAGGAVVVVVAVELAEAVVGGGVVVWAVVAVVGGPVVVDEAVGDGEVVFAEADGEEFFLFLLVIFEAWMSGESVAAWRCGEEVMLTVRSSRFLYPSRGRARLER